MSNVDFTANSAITNALSNNSNSSSSTSSTSKTELSTEDFFQLIAAQLQNQDMSNPMDNAEMMSQMTQIAMMEAMENFSTSMQDFSMINTIQYGTSMMGKNVVIYNTADGKNEKLSGTVTRVDVFGGTPTVYIDDDETGYSVANIMSVYEEGHDPTVETDKTTDSDNTTDTDNTTDADNATDADNTTDTDNTTETDNTTDTDNTTETDNTTDTDNTSNTSGGDTGDV